MAIGGSWMRAGLELILVSDPFDGKLFKGVVQGLFSLEGSKWSISIMGGNNWSLSDVWVLPREEEGDEGEVDAAAKWLISNYIRKCFINLHLWLF